MDIFSENKTEGLNILEATPAPRVPEDALQRKSEQYSAVLGDDSPGVDLIRQAVELGEESLWSTQIAQREKIRDEQTRMSLIYDIAAARDPIHGNTQQDIDLVDSLTREELYSKDVGTALSRNYSKLFVDTLATFESPVLEDSLQEDPESTYNVLDALQDVSQRRMIAQEQLDFLRGRREDESWGTTIYSIGKTLIPGYETLNARGVVKDAPQEAWMFGNNMDEQISYLYTLSPEGFQSELAQAIAHLEDFNPALAETFAQAVVSFSTADRALGNATTVLDVGGLIPARTAFKAGKALTKGAKGVDKAPSKVSEIAGDLGQTRASVTTELTEDVLQGDPSGLIKLQSPDAVVEASRRLPTHMNPTRVLEEGVDPGSAAQARAREAFIRADASGSSIFERLNRIDTLEPHQISAAAEEAFDVAKDIFSNASFHIIDSRVIMASEDKLTNTYKAVVTFGRKDGTPFVSEASARNFVTRNISSKTDDYEIVPNGLGGYVVEYTRGLSEVDGVRKLTIPTEFQSPSSLANKILYNVRSPDYLLPKHMVESRGVVVHSTEFLGRELDKVITTFKGLPKASKAELEQVLTKNNIDATWYNTREQFDLEFGRLNNKRPTDAQWDAYNEIIDLNDIDYVVRSSDLAAQYIRMGAEKITFNLKDADGALTPNTFFGKVLDEAPWGRKSAFSIRVVEDGKVSKTLYKGQKSAPEKLKEMQSAGFKLISSDDGKFYLVKDFKRGMIRPQDTLPYRSGGHHELRFEHYIKQGDVDVSDGISRYKGDISLASAPTAKQAQEVARLLDEARVMVKENNPAAKKFFDDNLSDFITMPEFIKKVKAGVYSLDRKIMATRSGQRTLDVDQSVYRSMENFVDGTDIENNIFAGIGGRYLGEKSEYVLDVLKSEGNRVIKTDHSSLLDPMKALEISSRNLMDTWVANDLRFKASQDWLQEFGHLMDAPIEQVSANPWYYMKNPKYKESATFDQKRVAENVRRAAIDLNDFETTVEASINQWRSKITDFGYDVAGERGRQILSEKMLPAITNGDAYIRTAANTNYLGLFNVKHLFVQASEAAKTLMVSPVHGIYGVRASVINRMARKTDNEEVLRGIANKFAKISGWEKDDWLKMQDAYKRSGFGRVGRDQAYLDNVGTRRVGKERENGVLGQRVFYNSGESISRDMAYSTAWREYAAKFPGAEIDRFAERAILQRARDLTTNMSRDSVANWQKGYMSSATQFFGWHARMMEQMWDGGLFSNGKKLTRAEKARVLFGMGTLYGVGAPMGATFALWPWREQIEETMISMGIDTNHPVVKASLNGLVSTMFYAMSGADMDFTQSYGSNGLSVIKDLFSGKDQAFVEMFMGAGGSLIASGYADLFGGTGLITTAIGDMIEGRGNTLSASDLIEPLRNISSVNNSLRAWEAINTQKWLSKNGSILAEDVNLSEALMGAIFGVSPNRVSEAYAKLAVKYDTEDHQKKVLSDVRKVFSKLVRAAEAGDQEAVERYYKQVGSLAIRGGLSTAVISRAWGDALAEVPLTEKADEAFRKTITKYDHYKQYGK